MPNVFFTADTHFGHGGILRECNRPFSSIEEMDDTLVQNWNKQVGAFDHVWHLGDFAWRDHLGYRKRLNGVVHLVEGNHDKMAAYARREFAGIYDFYDGRVTGGRDDQRFFLIHYPMVTWPYKAWGKKGGHDYGRGTAHLYGHVHGRYDRPGDPAIDVGVDCRSFTLFPLDEVVSLVEHKVKTMEHNPCFVKQKEKTDADDTTPDQNVPSPCGIREAAQV